MNRRTFLKSTAAIAAAPTLLRAATPGTIPSQYTTALIGTGWWGTTILAEALPAGRSKLVAICDPDPGQMARCIAESKLASDPPKQYRDYREMLAKERPQIVINATPDHWHAQVTLDALRSGAHVYMEKPVSHTVLEGVAMVKATRASGQVVQVDLHRRVSPHNIAAREFVRSGKLGTVGMARAFVAYGGGAEKAAANSAPPKGMDWDLWCGPAPLRPFNSKIHTRGFRQFLDYANGQLGDWGVHWLDQFLWIMDETSPKTVFSAGGRPVRGPVVNSEAGQTSDAPDHQAVTYQFERLTATWEHRQFAGNNAEKGENVGLYLYGTEGTLHVGWQSGLNFYPVDGGKPVFHVDATLHSPASHNIRELWADFLDAIERKRLPVCDIQQGHNATVCALLGMLSLRVGRSVNWDHERQTIPSDPEAAALLKREYRAGWTYPTA